MSRKWTELHFAVNLLPKGIKAVTSNDDDILGRYEKINDIIVDNSKSSLFAQIWECSRGHDVNLILLILSA